MIHCIRWNKGEERVTNRSILLLFLLFSLSLAPFSLSLPGQQEESGSHNKDRTLHPQLALSHTLHSMAISHLKSNIVSLHAHALGGVNVDVAVGGASFYDYLHGLATESL